jgi:hypothetical protein
MIYIGYDPREQQAYDVCEFSITQRSSLEVRKLFTEEMDFYDRNTGEPQSTDFTFSRFFVPYMQNYEGYSIFVDCDFLFLDDPQKLIDIAKKDSSKAVWVCKHPRYIPNTVNKMDNIPQNSYEKKNWASLMVFNNSHPDCKKLTLEYLNNHTPGLDFHRFKWTDNVGSLPLDWNCLDDYYHLDNPSAIHYTDGGPWFEEYQNTFYSELWKNEQNFLTSVQKIVNINMNNKE